MMMVNFVLPIFYHNFERKNKITIVGEDMEKTANLFHIAGGNTNWGSLSVGR